MHRNSEESEIEGLEKASLKRWVFPIEKVLFRQVESFVVCLFVVCLF